MELSDASNIQNLAADRDTVSTTESILHPYPDGYAERRIGDCHAESETGALAIFAIILNENGPEDGAFVGIIELLIDSGPPSQLAQLSYWIGKPYWNHGYATGAAKAVVKHGFTDLGLERVRSPHFSKNPASGRVLQKIGISHEGTLQGHVNKWGVLEDVEQYGMPKAELAD